MNNKEKVSKIIFRTLESLLSELETKEDLDVLLYALNDYESEGYSMGKFREKYKGKIETLRELYYNKR